ncbi:MAG: tetratricopeptide repeat protein, partial [Planctomycetaceae bacterium]
GSLLLEKYNRAEALPELKEALKINPRAAETLVKLGEAAHQQLELEEADDYADQALQINPRLIAAWQLKADVEIAGGNTADALKHLEEALKTNPHEQRTLARIAACYALEDGLPPKDRLEQLLSHLDTIDQVQLDKPTRFEQLVIDLAKRNPKPGYFLNLLAETLDGRRQYPAAERLYLAAIEAMPQISEPKTGLGMLYMRTGNTAEAEKILEAAFDADPFHVRVSNMRKVLDLLGEYDTIETEHFIIRIDREQDRLLGEYMAEYLEEIYPKLVKQFGYEPPQKTQFEIYNKAKGMSGHQWFSARMIGLPWIQTVGASTGMIVALTSPNAAAREFNWAQVLEHEFTHIITLQQTNFNIPHWFTEALAVHNEGYPRPDDWNELLLERVPKGELRNLGNLSDGFTRPESSPDWQFAYCQAELYAEYMIDEYGPETIPKLLAAYRDNLPTEKAIQQAFGVDLETFEQGYVEYLN